LIDDVIDALKKRLPTLSGEVGFEQDNHWDKRQPLSRSYRSAAWASSGVVWSAWDKPTALAAKDCGAALAASVQKRSGEDRIRTCGRV
jgi:hypothetical protein